MFVHKKQGSGESTTIAVYVYKAGTVINKNAYTSKGGREAGFLWSKTMSAFGNKNKHTL